MLFGVLPPPSVLVTQTSGHLSVPTHLSAVGAQSQRLCSPPGWGAACWPLLPRPCAPRHHVSNTPTICPAAPTAVRPTSRPPCTASTLLPVPLLYACLPGLWRPPCQPFAWSSSAVSATLLHTSARVTVPSADVVTGRSFFNVSAPSVCRTVQMPPHRPLGLSACLCPPPSRPSPAVGRQPRAPAVPPPAMASTGKPPSSALGSVQPSSAIQVGCESVLQGPDHGVRRAPAVCPLQGVQAASASGTGPGTEWSS